MTKKAIFITIILLLVAGGWLLANDTYFNPEDTSDEMETVEQNEGEEREQSQSTESPTTVEDDEGENTEEDSNGITSSSGIITVFSPKPDQVLKNGHKISGEAQINTVSYRIIDFERGVLKQGQLNAVDGKFSGTVSNLITYGNEGRIDIFSANPDTGTEENMVEIPVRFE